VIRLKPRAARRIERVGVYLAALLLAVYIVFPFAWTFIASFQTSEELFAAVPQIRPHNPWWINYYEVATARRWAPSVDENILQTYVPRAYFWAYEPSLSWRSLFHSLSYCAASD
jgi:ABC-type glycerol-3-phosphate transport system permease component